MDNQVGLSYSSSNRGKGWKPTRRFVGPEGLVVRCCSVDAGEEAESCSLERFRKLGSGVRPLLVTGGFGRVVTGIELSSGRASRAARAGEKRVDRTPKRQIGSSSSSSCSDCCSRAPKSRSREGSKENRIRRLRYDSSSSSQSGVKLAADRREEERGMLGV